MILSNIISFLSRVLFFTGKLGKSQVFAFDKKLSSQDEKMYFDRLTEAKLSGHTDSEAEEILVKHNLRLVAHIAKKYKSCYSDNDDLISIGSIGLIKAVRTFNPAKTKSFSSYASVCIENEILMVLRSEKKLSCEMSIDSPLGHDSDGNELIISDLLASSMEPVSEKIDKDCLKKALLNVIQSELDPREQSVVIMRFGLDGSAPLTQKEVAKILKISRSYISRIENTCKQKLLLKIQSNQIVD